MKYTLHVYTNKLNCLFTRITVTFIIYVSYYTSCYRLFTRRGHMSRYPIHVHIQINQSKYRCISIN